MGHPVGELLELLTGQRDGRETFAIVEETDVAQQDGSPDFFTSRGPQRSRESPA